MTNTGADFQKWVCDACGYIYDEAEGDPDSGLAPGTRYADIPDDWQCPLCGLAKSDLRLLPEAPQIPAINKVAKNKTSNSKCRGGNDYVVIVGAGVAGWSVAEAIRQQDQHTPVLLISACAGISYPKPALSTAFAHGKSADDIADLDALTKAGNLNIDVRTDTRVIKIDTHKKRLTTAKGGIEYNKLILALGAQQRHIPVAGDAADSILRINDLASYRKLRTRLDDGVKHISILGAGLIGCEFAEDFSTAGYQVSVIDPSEYCLSSLIPGDTAIALQQRLEEKNVSWYFGNTLDHLDKTADGFSARLSNNETVATDLVISAAGLVANTQLAEKSGIDTSNGVNTNSLMQTSLEDVYAIGDCASVEGQVFAYIEPIRRQAETIAAHLNGQQRPFVSKPPLVRIKIPSFPLTVCQPHANKNQSMVTQNDADSGRINYLLDDDLIGFVLSGTQTSQATKLYQEIFN